MVKFRIKIFSGLLHFIILVMLPALCWSQSDSEMKKIFSQAESFYLFGEYELANPLYILLDDT